MFVSNSDNLGATLDLKLLTYFAQSGRVKKQGGRRVSGRDVGRVKTMMAAKGITKRMKEIRYYEYIITY